MELIVRFAASEKLGDDAWATLVGASLGYDFERFEKVLRNGEAEWKEKQEGAALPGAYRSAKSVVLGAMRLNIPLFSDNGTPVGKSAIQASIKAAKEGLKEGVSPIEQVERLLERILSVYEGASSVDQLVIRDCIDFTLRGLE